MAIIRPFAGVRYSPDKVGDLSAVVSQPYDRIGPDLQARYYDLSPYNVVRLIKGREQPGDGEDSSVYTRARDQYQAWRAEGVLMRESAPALYVLHQTFTLPDGSTRTRQGLVAALELSRFDEGVVLPHERTLSGPKVDRLNLMRATAAQFGHIFMLYPGGGINELLRPVIERDPGYRLRELFEHDVEQHLWVVNDPATVAAVVREMAPRRNLIIADGHHRYETALNYRDEMRAQHPDMPADAAFNYVMVTMVSMEDAGLVILPTHRLIHSYGRMSASQALEQAGAYFDVARVDSRAAMERLLSVREPNRPRFGFYDGGTYAVLTLRDARLLDELLSERAPAWRTLDVTVLHELFIERVLGIDKGAVERHEHIEYLRDPAPGYAAVAGGQAEFLLVMNPTRMEQVQACTTVGERMPQKSTDFYPKVISGLVMMPVGAEERNVQ
ncbi:MAG: DUF1015 domain-containing protein [Anaerolineales bacterium]|nr:DUF1015 domain-containing protein [Anaerolineales bacterium]